MAGELLGVSATDALELGIDIGALDCAISVGFPGTVSSLRQQWGRAAGAAQASPCSSPARTRSTSTSCASRKPCSAEPWRRPSSTTRTHASSTATCSRPPSRAHRRGRRGDARAGGARACRGAAGAEEDGRRLRLGRNRLPGRARPAQVGRARLVHRRRRRDRHRARARRALARVLDRPRRRRLPPPRRAARRQAAGRRRPRRARRPRERRLVHAGEEGDADLDRRAAAGRAPPRARADTRPRLRHRAGDRVPAQIDQRRRRRSRRSRSTFRRRASRPRRSGSLRRPPSSKSSRRCRSCCPRSTRPSTR